MIRTPGISSFTTANGAPSMRQRFGIDDATDAGVFRCHDQTVGSRGGNYLP